jgi:hypothetical protein
MWSDNESSIDLLGFQHLVSAVSSIIENESLLPATIGVYGDWGSGKSSLVKMVEARFANNDDIVVLSFNGWLFEGYEDAKTALMGTVLEELQEHRTFVSKANEAAKNLAKKLLARVNVFKAIWGVGKLGLALNGAGLFAPLLAASGVADLGEAAKGLVAGAGEEIKEHPDRFKGVIEDAPKEASDKERELRKSIRDFRKDFEKLLDESKIKTLVIVIDDLDRCMPDTIIETLEAIKLFLFVKKTAFILGADERLVKYAVKKRFPELPGERVEVGRDYLEKLVQFPIRVPPLGPSEVETYIGLLYAGISGLNSLEMAKATERVNQASEDSLMSVRFNLDVATYLFSKVPEPLAARLRHTNRIAPLLGTGLNGNPRQCKRFLNALLMRLGMAKSRNVTLDEQVLAKLMLLEYFRPESFRRLAQLQSEQQGRPSELSKLELAVKPPASVPAKPALKVQDGLETEEKPTRRSGKSSDTRVEIERKAAEDELSAEFQLWITDPWTKQWLELEPALAGVKQTDLRPYFYFSRDQLGQLSPEIQRLSPMAQEALNQLLHESEAVRGVCLKSAPSINGADAVAVFEALASRARLEEDPGEEQSAFNRLFDWVTARKELRSQLIHLLGRFPEQSLTLTVVSKLVLLCQGTDANPAAMALLEQWSNSNVNAELAAAAKARLNRGPR